MNPYRSIQTSKTIIFPLAFMSSFLRSASYLSYYTVLVSLATIPQNFGWFLKLYYSSQNTITTQHASVKLHLCCIKIIDIYKIMCIFVALLFVRVMGV